jgi:BASS family bile acid:Na+ symporter
MDGAAIQTLAVQALNVSLMFSVGLEIQPSKLRTAARQWGRLLGITALNFGALPLVVLCLVHGVDLPYAVGAGLLLSACAPGGGTGTLLTRVAGGNLELSVVLLAIFTGLAVVLTPLLSLAMLSSDEVSLDLGSMLTTLVLFQLVPLCAGLALRSAHLRTAIRANRLARPASNALFAALVLGLLVTQGHLVVQVGAAGIAVILFAVITSLALPLVVPGSHRDRAALSLTTGVRNLSLALLLSSAFFGDMTTITVLAYGLFMYLLSVPLALLFRRQLPPGSMPGIES